MKINRPMYLNQLFQYRDKQVVKVLTGVRLCGKSTMIDVFCDWLLATGTDYDQLVRVDLDDPDQSEMKDHVRLVEWIQSKLLPDKMNYIFIDEAQQVPYIQKVIEAFIGEKNCDIYITSSNSCLLSGEFSTIFSGRYVEIKMFPLSFREYMSLMPDKNDLISQFKHYLQISSFPYAMRLYRKGDIQAYLGGIYAFIILKDVMECGRVLDVQILKNVTSYIFDNIGYKLSSTNIANTMTSNGNKISFHTVESYLTSLLESFILYKTTRYDVKGKQHLATLEKYYLVDIGLRYFLLGKKNADMGRILENVVYLELLRRGYEVYLGKVDQTEVDFVAFNDKRKEYYQVAYTVNDTDGSLLSRELAPLNSIRDHNPKYLLTMDSIPATSHNGIMQINALEWLLQS